MPCESYTTTHADTVQDRNLPGLSQLRQGEVEKELTSEEVSEDEFVGTLCHIGLVQANNVATCAKSLTSRSAEHEYAWTSTWLLMPVLQLTDHDVTHFGVDRVELLWCVKLPLRN